MKSTYIKPRVKIVGMPDKLCVNLGSTRAEGFGSDDKITVINNPGTDAPSADAKQYNIWNSWDDNNTESLWNY